MTIGGILSLTYDVIRTMSKDELYPILRYAKQQTDKRVTNYKKAKEKDDTLYAQSIENFLENKYGKFEGRLNARKSMTRNEMIAELSRAQKLFQAKSGTVRGARKLQKEMIDRIVKKFTKDMQKEKYEELSKWGGDEWEDYWRLYRRFMDEQGGTLGTLYSSDDVIKTVAEEYTTNKTANIIEKVRKKLGYLEEMEYTNKYNEIVF